MSETKKRVYTGRGITRKLKAYIPETDNMMILCETSVCEAVVNRICHQFPQAAVYMAVTSQHMNTFDAMEAIVHFLYHKGFRKHSSMLIVGGQQLKALGDLQHPVIIAALIICIYQFQNSSHNTIEQTSVELICWGSRMYCKLLMLPVQSFRMRKYLSL